MGWRTTDTASGWDRRGGQRTLHAIGPVAFVSPSGAVSAGRAGRALRPKASDPVTPSRGLLARRSLHLEIFGTAENSSDLCLSVSTALYPQWLSIGPRDTCRGLFQEPLRLQHARSSLPCDATPPTRRPPTACRTLSARLSPRLR